MGHAGQAQQPDGPERPVQPVARGRRDERRDRRHVLRHRRRHGPQEDRRLLPVVLRRRRDVRRGRSRSRRRRPTRRRRAPTRGNQYGDYNGLSGYAGRLLPLLDRPPQRRQGRDLDREGHRHGQHADLLDLRHGSGTSGVTVTAGTGSATTDASNAYTIPGLAAGTYTVTPSKSGCTFSPASTVGHDHLANVTGVTFTASCPVNTYSHLRERRDGGRDRDGGVRRPPRATRRTLHDRRPRRRHVHRHALEDRLHVQPGSSVRHDHLGERHGRHFTASCPTGDVQLTSGVAADRAERRQERLEVLLHHGPLGRHVPRPSRRRPRRATSTSTRSSTRSRPPRPTPAARTRSSGNETCSPRLPLGRDLVGRRLRLRGRQLHHHGDRHDIDADLLHLRQRRDGERDRHRGHEVRDVRRAQQLHGLPALPPAPTR